MEILWGLMDSESSVGLMMIIAFLLGAGATRVGAPKKTQLSSILTLVEAVASHLGPAKSHKEDGEGE